MKKKWRFLVVLIIILFWVCAAHSDSITKPHTFNNGDVADAEQVNENFDMLYNQVNNFGAIITDANLYPDYINVLDSVEITELPSGAGLIRLIGPNGYDNIALTTPTHYDNNGYIAVNDSNGDPGVSIFVNSSGQGVVSADIKNFTITNPDDKDTDIWYASIEGPESGVYIRGTAELVDGQAVITFPKHFSAVSAETNMTVQVTPLSEDSKGLAVTRKSLSGVEVVELFNGSGNYSFDWEVKCVRKGYEDYQVIRPKYSDSPD